MINPTGRTNKTNNTKTQQEKNKENEIPQSIIGCSTSIGGLCHHSNTSSLVDCGHEMVVDKSVVDKRRAPLTELNINTTIELNKKNIDTTIELNKKNTTIELNKKNTTTTGTMKREGDCDSSLSYPTAKKKKENIPQQEETCLHRSICNTGINTGSNTGSNNTGIVCKDSNHDGENLKLLSEFEFLLEREKKQANIYYFTLNGNSQNSILTTMYESIVHSLCEFCKNCKYLHSKYCIEQNASDICRYCYMNEHVFGMSYLFARRLCFNTNSSFKIVRSVNKLLDQKQKDQFYKLIASSLYRIALKVADLCFPFPNLYSFSKYILKDNYVSSAIPNMEIQILYLFNYDHLLASTPVSFLSVLMNASMCCDNALTNMLHRMKIEERVIELLTNYNLLKKEEVYNVCPSKICCGALAFVRKELNLPPWSDSLQQFTSYQFSDFESVVNFFSEYH